MKIVDFHCHHMPARFELTTAKTAPPGQQKRWAVTNKLLSDESALLKDIESGDIDARVVNAPIAFIADADGHVAPDIIPQINDALADLATRRSGQIYALATVDAFDGERAARELERAVTDLGLSGCFVDCAKGDFLIDAPAARPVLAAASQLKIPVFIHPITPEPQISQMKHYGRLGVLFSRGTSNAAALIALLENGVFKELPDLKVVVTALAFGGLALASGFTQFSKLPDETRQALRRNVFIDTMDFNPTLMKASAELVGTSNVVMGSDWPIVSEGPVRTVLEQAMSEAGLNNHDQVKIASANTLRLLAVEPTVV